jgi:predicted metal-dependent peptidase
VSVRDHGAPRSAPPEASEADAALLRAEAARVSALRVELLEAHPFWGWLLLQVRLVPSPGLGAFAATDCLRHIWYDPTWTRHLTARQLGFVLAHELGHMVLASLPRRRGRQAHLWNCATDYAINRIVAAIPDSLGSGRRYDPPHVHLPGVGDVRILLDARWDGRIAEAIYEELSAEALPDPRTVTVTLRVPDGGVGDAGDGGAGASRRLPGLTDHGGGIDIHLPDTLTPAERGELRERMRAAAEAWADSGRRGDAPAELLRGLRPGAARVPWRRVLRAWVGQATAKDELSLRRPNRRWLAEDLVVPGLHAERAGHVVVALDTSGSMSRADLEAVAAELEGLSRHVEEITLLVGDTDVRRVVSTDGVGEALRSGHLPGGGGTDHRPFFAWVAERRLRPDLFVGLTDLRSRFPERRPPYPVLWVAPEGHGRPPWGRVLALPPHDTARAS